MKTNRTLRSRMAGGALLWVLLGCAVVGIAAYLYLSSQQSRRPVVVMATPPPATPEPIPEPATPPPVVKATPTPPPIVMATPTPPPATPPPLDLATVVRSPGLWPPYVALVQPHPFPLALNGRIVGEAKAPAGTPLRVFRLYGQQVEVEYQAARHFIPIAATDLMVRALATFRNNGNVVPEAPVAAATPMPMAAEATPVASAGGLGSVKIGERLMVDVSRIKRSRIEGGDYDDKRERIELKIKFTNTDTRLAADKLKAEVFIFAESILDRAAVKLLLTQEFPVSVGPRSSQEMGTEEVTTMYDTTDARFGHRYEGWVLRVKDATGNLVMAKASSPSLLRGVEKATALEQNKSYDRSTFKEKAEAGRVRR